MLPTSSLRVMIKGTEFCANAHRSSPPKARCVRARAPRPPAGGLIRTSRVACCCNQHRNHTLHLYAWHCRCIGAHMEGRLSSGSGDCAVCAAGSAWWQERTSSDAWVRLLRAKLGGLKGRCGWFTTYYGNLRARHKSDGRDARGSVGRSTFGSRYARGDHYPHRRLVLASQVLRFARTLTVLQAANVLPSWRLRTFTSRQ